ncbi:RNA 2',3'-cyclic phosphodiesterase [Roseovarius atlanticus]|uniref:RNA 2',3'-cyclic phosphodiesterase n=1 Tax=Roseovarius atlanticus TaxID=1641875 RepID=UPI001C95CDC0|nr:RNA 2',3'-cyclic phosphodiesterase [Roseovarius atlanticus]MBY5987575.1 RNA 2',3'-cyclic phosphodiesterase [Roseovarius atlanticus]MBY6122966.1 RNA 2',3'-cyclic phosphodiesterase [Roseovarius atlanticus]MBY6147462.1 RNA 2',3'-cyclic phosphodiesterase [Roseovarius atlanticus]
MRVFVGVPLEDAAIAALLPVQEALRQGRLVDEENLHLTLAFLDDQPEDVLAELDAALGEIRVPRWDMEFTGVEAKGGRRPALVWADVAKVQPLRQLHDKVRGAARLAGIDLPRERFRPHVTLARFGRSRPVDMGRLTAFLSTYGGFRAGPFPVERFCLYASTLTPEGPVYDVLAEYPL